jgi:glycosyltransferase involved in cell wall biosynthesis
VSHLILVVPCYDEAERLDREAFRRYTLPGHRVEFLFVDDGSRDATLSVLQALAAEDPSRYSVLALEKNLGKAEAVRRGLLAAIERKPDLTGFWDADLATPLAELSGYLAIFESRPEIAMVFGARVRLLGRSISRRASRHYVGRMGATLISRSLGLAVYDTQCGAKLFRVTGDLKDVLSKPFLSRWIFDVEIIARFVKRWGRELTARSIYELPITCWHDVKGSKVKGGDFVRALRELWKIHRAYNR